jgi:hypothetical protein
VVKILEILMVSQRLESKCRCPGGKTPAAFRPEKYAADSRNEPAAFRAHAAHLRAFVYDGYAQVIGADQVVCRKTPGI